VSQVSGEISTVSQTELRFVKIPEVWDLRMNLNFLRRNI